jgi:hypothetical protein
MALDSYVDGDPTDYLSTDPYAGQAPGKDATSWTLPSPSNDPSVPNWYDQTPAQYRPPTTPAATSTTPTSGPYGGDPTDVDAWLAWMAQQPGHDPILDTPQGIAYYRTQILSKPDKLNANNLDFWQKKATLAQYGGGVGAPEGGGGYGDLWNKMPTLADIQGIPGYQAAIDEATRGFNTGAAAKGTLLNGRTQAALGDAVSNKVLSDFYFPFANLQYQFNQGNAGNLFNLASLGLNGSSVGAA